MCDPVSLDREWRSFIVHMIESGESVLTFTDGMNVDEFQKDERTYKATLWDIRIIGEAARRIPVEVRQANPHIDWRQMIGMRDRITHVYEKIDVGIVWDTIKTDIPQMLADLRELLNQIDCNTSQTR